MDVLKIAVDTLIVGALAAPWLLLLIDFFFPEVREDGNGKGNGRLSLLLSLVGEKNRGTVAAVLLAATAYLLGAGVSRVAEDFFDDADSPVKLTESHIRASVYCNDNERHVLSTDDISVTPGAGNGKLACKGWRSGEDRDGARAQVEQIFHLQESALWLTGEDKVSTLRYLHQQIMVLRGSAFDGLITCVLCLFGWWATKGPRSRRVLAALPIGLIFYAVYSFAWHFVCRRGFQPNAVFDDPPLMELTWLAIGAVGCCLLLWKGAQPVWKGAQPARPYLALFFLAALLAGLAYSGWWRTEILYDRLVINTYYAQSHSLLKPTQ